MQLNNVEHIKISDSYKIYTDEGNFALTVTMHPQTEKEPTMNVTSVEGGEVAAEVEAKVVELFLAAGSAETAVAP